MRVRWNCGPGFSKGLGLLRHSWALTPQSRRVSFPRTSDGHVDANGPSRAGVPLFASHPQAFTKFHATQRDLIIALGQSKPRSFGTEYMVFSCFVEPSRRQRLQLLEGLAGETIFKSVTCCRIIKVGPGTRVLGFETCLPAIHISRTVQLSIKG
jgi:hypothetical protein